MPLTSLNFTLESVQLAISFLVHSTMTTLPYVITVILPYSIVFSNLVLPPLLKPNLVLYSWMPMKEKSSSSSLKNLDIYNPPIHCNNKTATGIANNTIKKHHSCSMEMRYFWITDQVHQKHFDVKWHPGQKNLGDYFSEAFDSKHHVQVHLWYLHLDNSPRHLPHAVVPSSLRGCVGTLENGYTKSVPLHRFQVELSKSSPSSRAAKVLQTVAKHMLHLLHSWPWP